MQQSFHLSHESSRQTKSILVISTYAIRIMKSAITMELTLVELAFVDDTIWELKLADTLRPAIIDWANKVTARPL